MAKKEVKVLTPEERDKLLWEGVKNLAMAHIVHSCGNAYVEEAVCKLEALGAMKFDLKHLFKQYEVSFDRLDARMQQVFGDNGAKMQFTQDYEILKKMLDEYLDEPPRNIECNKTEDTNES